VRVRVGEMVYWERETEREISRGGFSERDFERVGTARWCGSPEGMPDGGAVRWSERERDRREREMMREREREREREKVKMDSYPF
jgi:hypothetical protein